MRGHHAASLSRRKQPQDELREVLIQLCALPLARLLMHNNQLDHSTAAGLETGHCVADSQFDYPFSKSGWQYQTLDPENRFGSWSERAESTQSATPMAFLVCEDPHCMIGRDFVHPGHTHRPSIQWNADQAGAYRIDGEFALLRSTASGNLVMQLYIDDVREIEETLNFPETLKFSVACHLEAGSFVRLVFGRVGVIDNNHCLFYARVNRLDADHGLELISRSVKKSRPGSWRVLDRVLHDSLGYGVPTRDLAALSHRLFADETQPGAANKSIAHAIHSAHFAHHNQNFRLPRTFKIRRVDDDYASAAIDVPEPDRAAESAENSMQAAHESAPVEIANADHQPTEETGDSTAPAPISPSATGCHPAAVSEDIVVGDEDFVAADPGQSSDTKMITACMAQSDDLPVHPLSAHGREAGQQNA